MNLVEQALEAAEIELNIDDEGDVFWACTQLPYDYRYHRFVVSASIDYHDDGSNHMLTVHTVLVTLSLMGVPRVEPLTSITRVLP